MVSTTLLLQWRPRLVLGLGGVLLLVSGVTFAGPGPESAQAGPGGEQLRTKLEVGMGQLASQEDAAQRRKDFVRTACVVDKREQGEEVMELGTDELLIIRDPASGEQARTFALEKLEAAAERMDLLVDEARNCGLSADQAGEEEKARTEQDKEPTIPVEDPTAGMGEDPVPPVIDGSWPAVASASE